MPTHPTPSSSCPTNCFWLVFKDCGRLVDGFCIWCAWWVGGWLAGNDVGGSFMMMTNEIHKNNRLRAIENYNRQHEHSSSGSFIRIPYTPCNYHLSTYLSSPTLNHLLPPLYVHVPDGFCIHFDNIMCRGALALLLLLLLSSYSSAILCVQLLVVGSWLNYWWYRCRPIFPRLLASTHTEEHVASTLYAILFLLLLLQPAAPRYSPVQVAGEAM